MKEIILLSPLSRASGNKKLFSGHTIYTSLRRKGQLIIIIIIKDKCNIVKLKKVTLTSGSGTSSTGGFGTSGSFTSHSDPDIWSQPHISGI